MRKLLNEELGRLSADEVKASERLPVVVVLEDVRSHLNVGSVFRTADAFGIDAIHLCGITGCPPHRDIHKTALGATESIPWTYWPQTMDCIAHLKQNGYIIYAIEQAEQSVFLNMFKPLEGNKYAFVFGNEVEGVTQEVVNACDGVVEIPQYGSKHSLNIAVSAGVVLWDVTSKIRAAKA